MRIIARSTLVEFWGRHPQARPSLARWIELTKNANWSSPRQVCDEIGTAKAIDAERVRFEIHGGAYRLTVLFDFLRGIAFVKFIGTRADYDAIDARTVSRF